MSSEAIQTYGRLKGKVAIVTGASSGYGMGIALAFAREGATVINSDLNPPPAAQSGEQAFPDSIVFRKHDVTSRQQWDDVFAFAKEKYGGVDILVNNAGTSYRNKPTIEVTEKEFDMVMNVNLKSIFHSIASLLTILNPSRNRPTSIINISSIGAHRPRGGLVWYNASKAAVLNATKGLAAEYAPIGVRVNAILPLLGATALFGHFTGVDLGEDPEEVKKRFIGNVPMGRLCTPEDVAGCAVWLGSSEASFVTGQGIEVDGGKCIS